MSVEPDITNERLYEMYMIECEATGITPRLKDYIIWVEENF